MFVIKAPIISELTPNSCLVEWQAAKLSQTPEAPASTSSRPDSLEYCLQVQSVRKDTDYREIYRGEQCSYRFKELDSNTEYNVRVCAVRLCYSNEHTIVHRICSPFSPAATFSTVKLNNKSGHTNNQANNKHNGNEIRQRLNSTQLGNSSGGNSSTNNSSSRSRWLSLFTWSSFFSNFNSKSTQPTAAPASAPLRTSFNSKSHLNSKKSKTSALTSSSHHNHHHHHHGASTPNGASAQHNQTTADSQSSEFSKGKSRTTSDQFWALALIFILVLFAFLIAYAFNSIYYTSYFAEQPTTSDSSQLPGHPTSTSTSKEL